MKARRIVGIAVAAGIVAGGSIGATGGGAAHATGTSSASALVYMTPTGWPGLTTAYRFNSNGAGLDAGPIATGRVWIDVRGNDGAIGTAHLTMWHRDGDANDPICSIDAVAVVSGNTRITVQCFDAAGVPANQGQFFLTYTNQPRPDGPGVAGPSFVRLTTDAATAKAQYPSAQYRSSGTDPIVVYRQNPGIYQVRVPAGALAGGEGVAFASAVGASARWCNPQAWYPVSGTMYVDVRCYAPGGALADSQFSLTLTRTNVFGTPAYRGGSQWAPWTSSSYVASSYRWNSAGAANTVRSGTYTADAAAETYIRFDGTAPAPTTSIVVSGYGPYRCNLHRDGDGAGGGDAYLWVVARCIDASGALVTQAVSASKVLAG